MSKNKKPHILYWKWNDEMLDIEKVQSKTHDIIARSIFDLIFISLHPMSSSNRILSNNRTCEMLAECSKILKESGRKLVLDVDVRGETEYLRKNPLTEKDYMTKYMEDVLDEEGKLIVHLQDTNGVFSVKCAEFDQSGYFIEDTVTDLTDYTSNDGDVIYINAGQKFACKKVIFFPKRECDSYDMCGDEYKNHCEILFEKVLNIGISGAATDEWGLHSIIEIEGFEKRKSTSTEDICELKNEVDLDTIPFVLNWFHISDGLCKYYEQYYKSNLIDDLIWFRNSSSDTKKGEQIVNQYITTIRRRIVAGENSFYNMTKKYLGEQAYVMCHPTWWGDLYDSNFECITNGLDWWEVKRDFAQTDELILIPVRMSMARKCPENLWYNMWYSMRTMDIKTYFNETWVNARFGGRTHYLGYECYEPGVVLTLYQEGRLEAISDMECEIEKLNHVQTSRPDTRVLVIFGYEAVSNWKIAEPESNCWRRVAPKFHNIWKFTNELFHRNYLCEAIPSYEIENGNLTIQNGKASYCRHEYDAVIVLYPIGLSDVAKKLILEYGNTGNPLVIIGDERKELKSVSAKLFEEADAAAIETWLIANQIKRNCGDNYCVYEDGSILFTTNGEKNRGNRLNIDCVINEHKICFEGEDYLYLDLKTKQISCGKKKYLYVDEEQL